MEEILVRLGSQLAIIPFPLIVVAAFGIGSGASVAARNAAFCLRAEIEKEFPDEDLGLPSAVWLSVKKALIADAAAGLLCVGLLSSFGAGGIGLALCLIALASIAACWFDLRTHLIPEMVTVPLFWGGLLLSPLGADLDSRAAAAFLACFLTWVSFKLISLIRKEDMTSGGDIFLASAGGAWIGLSWLPYFLLGAALAHVAASLIWKVRGFDGAPMAPAFSLSLIACAAAAAAQFA